MGEIFWLNGDQAQTGIPIFLESAKPALTKGSV
jgi:hypothetical protein